MDEDTQAVTDGLRRALVESGLTQAELAAALGTSASRFSTYLSGQTQPKAAFYLRALRLAAGLRAARERGWMTPPSTTREIARSLRRGDELRALKMALQGRDHLRELLRTASPAARAWEAAPRGTGDRRWDALLAALTEHEFSNADRTPPAWTGFATSEPLLVESLLLTDQEVRDATPAWLARHGVFADERDLATA